MRPTIKRLSAAVAGALLLACSAPGEHALSGSPGGQQARSADNAYLAARRHHLAGRQDEAAAAYHAALAADGAHVNARNGLATLYAEQGDVARAIPIWRALTDKATLGSGPGIAYLFNNLGYAYLLNGEYDSAVAALEKSCLLDPLNYRAWLHLGHALHKLGQEERARQMFSQANALQEHDIRRDYVSAGGGAVPAIDQAIKSAPRQEPEWAANDIVQGSNGILELRRIPAARAPVPAAPVQSLAARPERVAPAAVPASALQATPAVALLEIRNGNGVTGMARALSRQMADPMLKVVRLSNERGFNVGQTRVEYQGDYREAAERLAERFGSAQAVQVAAIASANVRLVIGRDLARSGFAMRPAPGAAPRLAIARQPDKAS